MGDLRSQLADQTLLFRTYQKSKLSCSRIRQFLFKIVGGYLD